MKIKKIKKGVGTTLMAAQKLNRRAIGIEIYEKFANIIKQLINNKELYSVCEQEIIQDNCRNILTHRQINDVQLMFTSPPYANFIQKAVEDRKKTHKKSLLVIDNKSGVKQYGEDADDFGNLDYQSFLKEIRGLMEKLFKVTKPALPNAIRKALPRWR